VNFTLRLTDRKSASDGAGRRRTTDRAGRIGVPSPYSRECGVDQAGQGTKTRKAGPIEMAFAKLKAFLRKVAARTIPDLWDAVARAIDHFEPDECENLFAHAGYDA
jgi:hypothetical protein